MGCRNGKGRRKGVSAAGCFLLSAALVCGACGSGQQEGVGTGEEVVDGEGVGASGLPEVGRADGMDGEKSGVTGADSKDGEGEDGKKQASPGAEGTDGKKQDSPGADGTDDANGEKLGPTGTDGTGSPDGGDGKRPEPSGGEDVAGKLPFNTDKLWGLDNLAKYVELDKIGKYAVSCLRWMTIWCESEHEGSFILDGFNEKEDAVVRQIYEATGKTACWVLQRDFDGDGREEAFAYVCGLESDGGIEVWFAAADGSVQFLMEDNTYSAQRFLELPGNTFYLCSIAGADNMAFFMYEVDGNRAKPAELEVGWGMDLLEDGRLLVENKDYDIYSSAADYYELACGGTFDCSYKDYYYYYDESGFHEYSGVPVTEEEFCQYENGLEILLAIQKADAVVKDIYYFANRRMVVNYVEKTVWTDPSTKDRIRHNYYLQVPVLHEGEEGFGLAWDDSLDIRAMQEMIMSGGLQNEYNIMVREGVYAPVFQEKLAEYPDYQPPFEYYKEQYAKRTKEDLKICALQKLEGQEEPERVLATGNDLAAISRRNLIFTFSDAFFATILSGNEQAGMEAFGSPGALLGLGQYEKSVGIWIGDECICKASLQNILCGSTIGFATKNFDHDGETSVYAGQLVYADNASARKSKYFTVEAAVKLHAFAEAVGLAWEGEAIRITEPGIYRAEQEYLVDLNGDGVEESLFYGGNLLLVDGKNYSAALDGSEDGDSFFLWDIDREDGILEIGLWNHGDNCSDYTKIYWYNGECLKETGVVEGPWDKRCKGITFDGGGMMRMSCWLSVLQTWKAPMSFRLNGEHELVKAEQKLYYPDLGDGESYPYTLRAPVRLYEEMDVASDFVVLLPGENMVFPATDDKNFVMVETEGGVQGYLYLENGINIENPDGGYYEWTEDVVGGLNYAG